MKNIPEQNSEVIERLKQRMYEELGPPIFEIMGHFLEDGADVIKFKQRFTPDVVFLFSIHCMDINEIKDLIKFMELDDETPKYK